MFDIHNLPVEAPHHPPWGLTLPGWLGNPVERSVCLVCRWLRKEAARWEAPVLGSCRWTLRHLVGGVALVLAQVQKRTLGLVVARLSVEPTM